MAAANLALIARLVIVVYFLFLGDGMHRFFVGSGYPGQRPHPRTPLAKKESWKLPAAVPTAGDTQRREPSAFRTLCQ